ncbi:MAG TPA: helix-turn-helix transcriptional regulator [Sedimentisphaerales bacterium]|nr:helix-turn-helix transcriptional regulator [Sedimentisphaerales bacterium]
MTKKKKTTTDAVKILHNRYIKQNKKRLESLERERENLNIAEQIYTLRVANGLSQKQLAKMVGTTQSVISRLEDADYNGHSLAMLRKIAAALHQKVQIEFVPEGPAYAFG